MGEDYTKKNLDLPIKLDPSDVNIVNLIYFKMDVFLQSFTTVPSKVEVIRSMCFTD